MVEGGYREYSLSEILLKKHYPQVFRVTRPYFIKGRECLKQGQFITLLDRRMVELVSGIDREGKQFKVRNCSSGQIEVIEEERIVYTLSAVIDMAKTIEAIEFRKEMRHEKQTFEIGEKFKIEKVKTNFRGKSINIGLRRERDNKVYRFPLDMIGHFKLITGHTVLPFSKALTLRSMPLTVQFRNTPTSSNFPPGIVTINDTKLCDIVYVLTVTPDTYTYEAFLADASIYVEKCNLPLPNPIIRIIPDGMFVNSSKYVDPIKSHYYQKMREIDSRLIEDIFAPGYYGSATFDKSPSLDKHLLMRERSVSQTHSLDVNLDRASRGSSECVTPDGECDEKPAPFPRLSKQKSKYRNTIQFPAITEIDSRSNEPIFQPKDFYRQPEKASADKATGMNGTLNQLTVEVETNTTHNSTKSSYSGSRSSIGSFTSDLAGSNSSKIFYDPNDSPNARVKKISQSRSHVRDVFRHYESSTGPAVPQRHSRSSSIATEDSGDSGVVFSYTQTNSPMQSPSAETPPTYATVNKIKKDSVNTTPAPPNHLIYENIHEVKVDINTYRSVLRNKSQPGTYDDVKEIIIHEPAYERISATQSFREEKPFSRFSDFRGSMPNINNTVNRRMNQIESLSQEDVGRLLINLGLQKYIHIFRNELINGRLLTEIDEETLHRDLKLTIFEARKLYKYVHGWRPNFCDINGNNLTNSMDPNDWTVETVTKELIKINLPLLSKFCLANGVDGSFLKELIEENLIKSIKEEHQVQVNGIEMSRLRAYVLKSWRPDSLSLSSPVISRKNSLVEERESSFSRSVDQSNTDSTAEKKERKYKPKWNRIIQ